MGKKVVVKIELELEDSTDSNDVIESLTDWAEQVSGEFMFDNDGSIRNIETDVTEVMN